MSISKPTIKIDEGQIRGWQRLLTLDAGRQPPAVPDNHGNAFVDTDECSSDILWNGLTEGRSLRNGFLANLSGNLKHIVVAEVVVDQHIPAEGSQLLKSNGIIQAG